MNINMKEFLQQLSITNWIAIASAIVAWFMFFMAWWRGRKASIKNKKALIRAKGYEFGKATWRVRIWNDGEGTARNIRFIYEDIEEEDSGIYLLMEKGKFPYPLLNAGDSFEIGATLLSGRNPVPRIKFIWDDGYKKDNEREQILEF
jgi:hypothetical protein